jgi:hypothetical protein
MSAQARDGTGAAAAGAAASAFVVLVRMCTLEPAHPPSIRPARVHMRSNTGGFTGGLRRMADSQTLAQCGPSNNRWCSLAAIGVANSVQRMLILCVGHPNARRVVCAFEAAQMQRSTRAFVFSAVELRRMARKAAGLRQTEKTIALTQRGLSGAVENHEPGRQWGGQRRE